MPKKKKPLEKDIQKTIIDYLRWKKFLVVKINNVGIFNQKTKKYIPPPQKGISDLLVCAPDGRFIAIEIKRPGNKPTPEQEAFLKQVIEAGGIAMVADNIDDVMSLVRDY